MWAWEEIEQWNGRNKLLLSKSPSFPHRWISPTSSTCNATEPIGKTTGNWKLILHAEGESIWLTFRLSDYVVFVSSIENEVISDWAFTCSCACIRVGKMSLDHLWNDFLGQFYVVELSASRVVRARMDFGVGIGNLDRSQLGLRTCTEALESSRHTQSTC